jgi:hypothetical protein
VGASQPVKPKKSAARTVVKVILVLSLLGFVVTLALGGAVYYFVFHGHDFGERLEELSQAGDDPWSVIFPNEAQAPATESFGGLPGEPAPGAAGVPVPGSFLAGADPSLPAGNWASGGPAQPGGFPIAPAAPAVPGGAPAEPLTVTPPVPPAVASSNTAGPARGPLTPGEIAKTLDPVGRSVRGCLEKATSAPTKVAVRIRVAGDGTPTFVGAEPTLEPAAATCVGTKVASVRFPATGAEDREVVYSFSGVARRSASKASGQDSAPSKSDGGRFKANPFN